MIDIGNAQIIGKRDNQEDYLASTLVGEGMLSIVADGMGGYEGGEVASQVAIKSFIEFFKSHFNILSIGELLLKATHYANAKLEVEKENNSSLEDMGCTLVGVYLTENTLYWVSVGDSILYRYSNMKLIRLNADHSVAGDYQLQVDAGEMTQEQAEAKPNRHALTSALTGYEIPHIEQSQVQVSIADRFIIASDGIHTMKEKELSQLIATIYDNQEFSDAVIAAVEKKNTPNQDNTTIITLEVKQRKEEIQQIMVTDKPKESKTGLLAIIIILLLATITFLIYENYADKIIEKLSINDSNTTLVSVAKDNNKTALNETNMTKVSEVRTRTQIDSNVSKKGN